MGKSGKNIVAVIHARGGSKRIPLKNIKPLNGIPLIGYCIKAALGSKLLDRVIVSSDHPDIMRISKEYGADVPFVRPADIAEDVASELVTRHAVKFSEDETGKKVDIVVTIQPTTPFVDSEDVDAVIQLLIDDPALESSFSAKAVHERPEWMFKREGGRASLFLGGILQGERGVMQALPPLYIPNGAVYATRRDVLFSKNVIISHVTAVHVMSAEKSVDIDEPIDFNYAEFMAEKHGKK